MLERLMGRATASGMLKEGMTFSSENVRRIAHRVANIAAPDGGFAGVFERVTPGTAAAVAGTIAGDAANAGAGAAGQNATLDAGVAGQGAAAGAGAPGPAGGQLGADGLPVPVDAAGGDEGGDLESQMVALADEQLRYEAMTRLLQKIYAQVRASVRER